MTHKFIVQYLMILASTLPLAACALPLTYSAEPMQARVIDADTKTPLEGVIVTANWQLEEGTPGGNVPVGQLMVMETVTDKNGKFAFPGWGPKTVWKGHLVNEDPQLLLFKPGYEYQRLYNKYNSTRELRTRKVRRSDWDGKIIEMKKFTGTRKEWLKTLERSIPPYDRPEDARQSLMLRAILAEENSIPDSIEDKRLFFDNIVRRLLEGR